MVGELVSSPALNKMLLRHARKSAAEIEEITGIPANEVAERLTALLDSRNWRDDLMEEKLLLQDVAQLIEDIREKLQNTYNSEEYASLARVLTSNVKLLLDQIEKRRKNIDADLSKVNEAQAKMMAMAIDLAMRKAVLDLRTMYPELEHETVQNVFEAALPEAIRTIEANQK